MDYGQEEAAAKFGDDPRVYLTTATKFDGDSHGHVTAVHTVQVEWTRNDKGQYVPKNVPGSEKVLPAQLVLLAMGFLGPEQPLLDALGVERDSRSNAKAEFEKYHTAAKASSSGPSTKAVAPPANATATSWAQRICRKPVFKSQTECGCVGNSRSTLPTVTYLRDVITRLPDMRTATKFRIESKSISCGE